MLDVVHSIPVRSENAVVSVLGDLESDGFINENTGGQMGNWFAVGVKDREATQFRKGELCCPAPLCC